MLIRLRTLCMVLTGLSKSARMRFERVMTRLAFDIQIERFGIQRGDIAAYNALWAFVQEGNPAQAHDIDHPEP
jgi:hypothetical protein